MKSMVLDENTTSFRLERKIFLKKLSKRINVFLFIRHLTFDCLSKTITSWIKCFQMLIKIRRIGFE